ncbi:palindromic element RPE4 domain-containing protein [Rickettsia japonica]|uniref:Palindromic element RPE4 domain-containing protein n=1 Tax=Rickettsia japonica TaxID=35790 RepID=A0ABM6YIH5_RICJA|nr:palindromic element RPE4 domain-containing protein [Rickettsia japonica]QHE25530.1 palindromic element RPE4 domain-containing protein [Rickettsia japonica]
MFLDTVVKPRYDTVDFTDSRNNFLRE